MTKTTPKPGEGGTPLSPSRAAPAAGEAAKPAPADAGTPTTKAPDFSKVTGSASSTEAEAPASQAPDFSKVRGSASSTEQAADAASYTVQKGDTLSHIAQTHYGKASAWKKIFEANRDQLDDPDRIQPGQVLKIPAAD